VNNSTGESSSFSNQEEDSQPDIELIKFPRPPQSPKKFKRHRESVENDVLHKASKALEMLQQPVATEDEFDIYGKYIANELRNVKNSYTLSLIKMRIQQVLFESQAPNPFFVTEMPCSTLPPHS
jgi:hypothetical protein